MEAYVKFKSLEGMVVILALGMLTQELMGSLAHSDTVPQRTKNSVKSLETATENTIVSLAVTILSLPLLSTPFPTVLNHSVSSHYQAQFP